MRHLLGVDLGTGSCKATLVAEDGTVTEAACASYRIVSEGAGWAEQDPVEWWHAAEVAVGEVLDRARVTSSDELALGFTGQMHSLVLLDEEGSVLRRSLLWCDERADGEAAEATAAVPSIAAITGNPLLPAFTLPHLLWVRRHEPEVFERVASVALPKDFLRDRITAGRATDWTDASGTGMADVARREWSDVILDALGIPPAVLPPILASDAVAGHADGLFGREIPTTVSAGLGDQFAEALSGGLVGSDRAVISLGTSAVLLGVVDEPGLGTFCHVPQDRWLRLDSVHAGGLSLTWLRDLLAPGEDVGALVAAAATAPAGSAGLVFLPFLAEDRLAGAAGPPGAFLGIRPEHGRAEFARAVLEGIAFELRRLHEGRPPVVELVLKGGGARSALWCEIIAAIFATPVRRAPRDAAFGAAMTAARAAGWWGDYASAPLDLSAPVEPRADLVARYGSLYDRYRRVAEALSGGWEVRDD